MNRLLVLLIFAFIVVGCRPTSLEVVVTPPIAAPVVIEEAEEVEAEELEGDSAETTPIAATPVPTTLPIPTETVAVEPNAVVEADSAEIDAASAESFLPVVVQEPQEAALVQSITVEPVATGFGGILFLTHAGDSRLFVVEQQGRIWIVDAGTTLATPFLDIDDRVNSGASEQGLLSVAFHPNYASNGRFYVYYTRADNAIVVSRFVVSSDPNVADMNSESEVLVVAQPYRNHNGGQLAFGPDGYLYVGLGDGGSGGDPEGYGQDATTLLGSMLRLDVDSAEPYAIPPDNPFVTDDNARNEIWSWGLRNPWRFSFDRANGDLYIADVGQNQWEEINRQAGSSSGGENYGWNYYEGRHCFVSDCSGVSGFVAPIAEYGRGDGCSVTGGYIYRGSALPALQGNYLFADFCTGHIWATIDDSGNWPVQRVLDGSFNVSSFGEDVNGELYVVEHAGTVYKISAAD